MRLNLNRQENNLSRCTKLLDHDIIAWFKLQSRNLGPILDANGWAVNARARINIPFGTPLTQLAKLPEGAQRSLDDPYAEKRTPLALYLTLILIALAAYAWYTR